MIQKSLPPVILIMGIIYIFFIPSEPQALKILFKIIPMLLILVYAYLQKQLLTSYQRLIMMGLFFCMLGDGLLIWFVVGLSAFLIGHIFYISSFIKRWHFSSIRFATIIPIVIYSIWIGNEMVSALHEKGDSGLIIPVICYISVISLMAWTSIMTGNTFAILGSLLFLISDSTLSWNKFIAEVPFSGPIIMITYYAAQFFIATSIASPSAKQMNNKMKTTVI